MDLINKKDFINAINLEKYKLSGAADVLMALMQIDKVNELYNSLITYKGVEFVDKFLEKMDITLQISPEEINRIPKTGAFIAVANHPFGGVDGLIFIKLLASLRPQGKIMANFLLKKLEPISEYIIPVNPFENNKELYSSVAGMKLALGHLQQGEPLGIFPAGEVSTYQHEIRNVVDREWQPTVLKLIKKAKVPVVPIYFDGKNSTVFHLLGLIHDSLRTATLPSELFNKKHTEIRIRIGNPITPDELHTFEDTHRMGRFIRAKTYALGSALQVSSFYKPLFQVPKKEKKIIDAIAPHLLESEIQTLASNNRLITKQNNFEVYLATANEIPHILNEIGRLREVTFREVGEGTKKAIDLDEYDLYYFHLFMWDSQEKRIVGAYRIGKGKEIIDKYGKKGLYIHSLFKLKNQLLPALRQSIELGRSFIVSDYQQKRLPLFLLWKGILFFLLQNTDCRYIIGPVSISNQFSGIAKTLIVEFIKNYHFDTNLAQFVVPRKRFKATLSEEEELLRENIKDFNQLDKIIGEIDPSHFCVPILLKKYIKQNAKIIGFNVDPNFNNALDGLMILDLEELPADTIQNLKRELN